ncbi:ribosome-associated translation inhibitor RaiA [Arenibacter sp. M-2]|uniref:ribosome hibernation-promoting factor, HPF/YfiA family n=1 Tax=unclassified Arenibacter TaxID=2615047 RepID=UPI000D75218B|nr:MULTISPECIES: ribosome-associated translation inhibitor RaiA [unclassified Arenibacter]MDL5512827.1 ribosome-associated translation inhibitor RaiA [Arenibacter sp. M-2]PXX24918.1 putative sigma-54 modulation protein [Arenibacter sp. ARW7G5Y1]|tara:strand:- start:17604 stop:17906 length:303 start_codon:yes stop_codon:yes gene_type:complete
MNINFEYDDVKASARLEELATKKLEKLEDKYDFIVRADVFFKKENTSSPDTGLICNIRLSAPGPRLFAESNNAKFEVAIAASVEELERQLEKRKGKMKTH